MAKNEFLLPDELGWDCNDEISKMLADFAGDYASCALANMKNPGANVLLSVMRAQYMDDIYAVIKKYQEKLK